MRPGTVIAERFEIERRTGAGGMSVVYRARDRQTGTTCAVKVLVGADAKLAPRFEREAQLLADLRHPGIVGYVHHGVTADGDRYLAMEWLEGEDLSERLARAPLGVDEALTLLRVVAEALAVAHARGVVHRDIKPSNLFLPAGDIGRVKILDFGIARLLDQTSDPTRTNLRIGTPAYMSPEQARGLSTLDGRTDLFSLGCVLYEALTGKKAFPGNEPMAVLAKILLADPPPIGAARADVPGGVVALVERLLSKEPAARPRAETVVTEAAALAAELEPAGAAAVGDRPARPRGPAALTARERRLLSVVLSSAPSLSGHMEEVRASIDTTGVGATTTGELRVESLGDGTILVMVSGTEAATDLAARAARVGLTLRTTGDGPVAIATGRAVVSGDLAVGEVIDRASRLVRSTRPSDQTVEIDGRAPARAMERAIRIDDVTAGLLDGRFEVSGDAYGLVLVAERAAGDARRTLLGRPTSCVGRDAELAGLEATFDAAADGEARAVLVTAAAGVGKSRLRSELLQRLAAREPAPEIWLARGDPLTGAAPFGMLGGMLRRAAGILDGEPLELRQRKLRARVARHVADEDVARVAEFLGELIGAPFDDADSVQLRAARHDAQLMADQLRRAWEDLLAAECAHLPVVLVLEDLQWGDAPTVAFVDAALRQRELPLLVLGLARPEVRDRFPRLWDDRGVQVFRLPELPRRAAERLVREVLGAGTDAAVVTRLVERAAGNAFYLEELVRAHVEGGGELPETVLSMVQLRLEGMEGEARRVLRAASVFGAAFWPGGVAELLGGDVQRAQVDDWLRELVAREVVSRRPESRFPGEVEYGFRSDLVREAAYAMLVDADRVLGHRLAGGWLVRVGEPSPTVLAEHFERGGEPQTAVAWWRRAAELALGGNDLVAVDAACERGIGCGAAGEVLGALRLLQAEARNWRADFVAGEQAAEQALRWLPPRSDAWYEALDQAATATAGLGACDRLVGYGDQLGDLAGSEAGRALRLQIAARVACHILLAGDRPAAERVWAPIEAAGEIDEEREPALAAAVSASRGTWGQFDGDVAVMLDTHRAAAEATARIGDLRRTIEYRGAAGYACIELGDYAEAVRELREVLATADRMGMVNVAATARQNLGLALAHVGANEEARAEEGRAIQAFLEVGNRRMEAASRYYLGYIRMLDGDLAGAEKATRHAVEIAAGPPLIMGIRSEGMAILSAILLARGCAEEARAAGVESRQLLDELGGIDGGESIIRLSHAEALHATGDLDGARAAIALARDRVLAGAAKIGDPVRRAGFLEAIPENARILRRAVEWGAPPPA